MKETDLFQPVKSLLEEQGYEVYSEVEATGGRADIVAVHGGELVAVELKTSLSLAVLEQAQHWTHYAHRSYVAVPHRKRVSGGFTDMVMLHFGIGLIEVTFPEQKDKTFFEKILKKPYGPYAKPDSFLRAKWNHHILPDLWEALKPEQRVGPPGGLAGGGYVTDYKLTMVRVREYMETYLDPGEWVTVDKILKHCETHYVSPKQGLPGALMAYEQSWCESKRENGRLYFRYKQDGTPQHQSGGSIESGQDADGLQHRHGNGSADALLHR